MTEQEIEKLNNEFSSEFDVLYNNITSNQAPGLDDYEKSVFLTKAQDEIVKDYFNPKSNKVQEGYDGNERRQIDFSMITRVMKYKDIPFTISSELVSLPYSSIKFNELRDLIEIQDGHLSREQLRAVNETSVTIRKKASALGKPQTYIASPFVNAVFDYRDNSKSIVLDKDILMFINEYVVVSRDNINQLLTVVPISYTEYSRLMSKPYKRPLKNQAWRLLDNSDGHNKAEIVIGPNDIITRYVIRYVKRPRAIRLTTFDDVTLDGGSTAQCCELDPILFPEIIQRGCELAKAAYTGDLQSQIALGQASQTNIGMVTQSR